MAELIPGEENLSAPFQRKVTGMAQRLGAKPDDLLGIMSFETGSSFSPSVRNQAGSGATGLIQFMPGTAQALGTSTQALAQMTPEQQLDMVEKYLTPYKGRLTSLKDTYMAVLYPDAVGQPDSAVLFREGTTAYRQNQGLDQGRKGYITVGDAVARVQRHAGGGATGIQRMTLDQEIDQEIARVRSRHQDDLTVPYLEDKNRQIDTEMQREIAKIRPLEALGAGVIASRDVARPGGTTDPETVPLGERLTQDAMQVVGGARDAIVNTLEMIPGVGDWIEEHVPEVEQAETNEGPFIRGVSQFLTSFLPALRGVKALGVTGRIASGAIAGAITDFAAFDPQSPRVSNLLNTLPEPIKNPVTEYLAASPDDTDAEGRMKNALEGAGIGMLAEGVFKVVSLMARARQVRADVDQTIKQTLPGDLPEGSVQARVMGEGEEAGARAPSQVTDEEIAQALPRREPPETGVPRATKAAPETPPSRPPSETPTAIRVSDETASDPDGFVTAGPATEETALEFRRITSSGEKLPTEGRVLHINFDKIQTGDDIKQTLAALSKAIKSETEVQRRGVVPVEETLARAQRSPYRELDRILGITPGTALNAEDARAVEEMFLAAGARLHALNRQFQQGDLSVADEWMKQVVLTANINVRRAGVEAEGGRTVNIFGVDMPSTEKYFIDNLSAILTNTTPDAMEESFRSVGAAGASQAAMDLAQQITGIKTKEQLAAAALALEQQYTPQQLMRLSKQQRLAAMLTQLDHPEQLARFMRQAQGITRADMFSELWYGALLSAPPTHVVNALDSALRVFRAIPERYFTTVTGSPSELSMNFRAANAFTYGLQRGLQEAWGYAANAWKTGVSQFGPSGKESVGRLPAVTAQNLGIEGSMLGDFADVLGAVARLPGRGLLAADEFFKVINYRMQLHESAFRQAVEEGYEGEGLAKQIVLYTDNPTPELHAKASSWAQYQTLGQPLDEAGGAFEGLGKFVAKLEAGRDDFFPARIILPFIRTPFNIVRQGLEYTPVLGNLSMNVNKALMAGGAEGALARSKMALGGMSMAMFGMMAMENVITGKAPADPGLRQTWERLGIQEYSVWVPILNKYVAYNRVDAVGLPMGLAADFVQIAHDAPAQNLEQLAGAAMGAIFNNLMSKTWMKNVADLVDAVTPGRGETSGQSGADFGRYVQRLVSGLAQPVAAVSLAARMFDPVQRQTRTMFDAWLARMPGMSSLLPPHLDLWGRPRLRSEPLGPGMVSPFMSRDYTPDAVDDELYTQRVPVRMPEQVIHIPRAGSTESEPIQLTPQQYNRYVELSAGMGPGMTPLKEALAELIDSPRYRDSGLADGPNGGKSWLIQDLIQNYRKIAKAHLRSEDPDVEKLLERKELSRVLSKTTQGQQQMREMNLQIGAPR